jgi:hypothetical protein
VLKSLVPTQSSQTEKLSCPFQSTDNFPEWKLAFSHMFKNLTGHNLSLLEFRPDLIELYIFTYQYDPSIQLTSSSVYLNHSVLIFVCKPAMHSADQYKYFLKTSTRYQRWEFLKFQHSFRFLQRMVGLIWWPFLLECCRRSVMPVKNGFVLVFNAGSNEIHRTCTCPNCHPSECLLFN